VKSKLQDPLLDKAVSPAFIKTIERFS